MGLPFTEIYCFNQLRGWRLHFAWLKLNEGYQEAVLHVAIEATVSNFKRKFSDNSYADEPIVYSIRSLLMGGGLSKERCISSFEILAKKILADEGIQTEKPGVVFRDLLSLKSLAPWSVMDISQVSFPLIFRRGREEDMLNQDGSNLNLEGCPVLCDKVNKLWTPISLADKDESTPSCPDVLLVCYAPIERAREVAAKSHLGRTVHMTQAFHFVMERAFLPNEV